MIILELDKNVTFSFSLSVFYFQMVTKSLCMHAKLLQSCLTLCNPMDCSLPGSSVHWILQARILECVAMPSPGNLPNPGIEPASLWRGSLPLVPPGKLKSLGHTYLQF